MIGKLAGGIALASLLVVAVLVARYESARDAWRSHAAIGAHDYDASASDAAYRDVEDALTWVERTVRASALVIVAAGVAIGRARPRRARIEGSTSRRIAARTLDLATLALTILLTRVRVSSPALAETIDWIAPALVLALTLGAATNGATLGERALRLAA